MTAPKRIRWTRFDGEPLPPNTRLVTRPSRYGNPFKYRDRSYGLVRYGPEHQARFGRAWDYEGRISADGNRHDIFLPKNGSDGLVQVETYVRWATREELVELFRLTLTDPTPGMRMAFPSGAGRFAKVTVEDIRRDLAGMDLACACRIDQPCHADVLLAVARGETP